MGDRDQQEIRDVILLRKERGVRSGGLVPHHEILKLNITLTKLYTNYTILPTKDARDTTNSRTTSKRGTTSGIRGTPLRNVGDIRLQSGPRLCAICSSDNIIAVCLAIDQNGSDRGAGRD